MTEYYGVKVSKDGKDITDIDKEMSFSSKYRNLTVYLSGTVDLTNPTTTTIAHTLGYVPIFLVWIKKSDNNYCPVPNSFSDHSVVHHPEAYMTDTGLYLNTGCDTSVTHTFKYVIFYEKLV
jgi:hypothetical protein